MRSWLQQLSVGLINALLPMIAHLSAMFCVGQWVKTSRPLGQLAPPLNLKIRSQISWSKSTHGSMKSAYTDSSQSLEDMAPVITLRCVIMILNEQLVRAWTNGYWTTDKHPVTKPTRMFMHTNISFARYSNPKSQAGSPTEQAFLYFYPMWIFTKIVVNSKSMTNYSCHTCAELNAYRK